MQLPEFVNRIKSELSSLPGEDAHRDMLPYRQTASEALRKPIDYRLSAVMLLLYKQADNYRFILTQRPNYGGTHSGQISFPGGKIEPSDASTTTTALRETEEEIGVSRDQIKVIGALSEVYIPVSNFLIHPYIGFIESLPKLIPDPREVAGIIHVNTFDLIAENNRVLADFDVPNGRIKNIPSFNFDGHLVWGATAIILNEFKFILKRMTP